MPPPVLSASEPALASAHSTQHPPARHTAIKLLRFIFHTGPRAFTLCIVVALLGSVAEGFGLVLLLPLLSAAGMTFTNSSSASRLASTSQDLLLRSGIPHSYWLATVLGVFLLTGTLRSMLRRSQSLLVATLTRNTGLALSERTYAAIVKAQWGFLVRQRAGRLAHLLTSELAHVQDAVFLTMTLLNLAALTLLYIAVALKLSLSMTLLVLVLGIALLALQRGSIGRIRSTGATLSARVSDVYTATQEHLLNLKSVKTYDAEDRDIQLFSDLCHQASRQMVAGARHGAAAAFWFETGSLLALAAVLFVALAILHVQPATMLLLLAIFTRLMPQLAAMQGQAHQLAANLPSFENIIAAEAALHAHTDPAISIAPTTARLNLTQELRLDNVWFAYQTDASSEAHFVLKGVTLPIRAGLITAVAGPSGAGKSTIADLANGLLNAARGHLILDGTPFAPGQLSQWRRQVGYVGQDTVLFHQSIRANLLWAFPEATDADLRHALTLAAATFVYDLPKGLETIAGDRGILLSSGQRQRIALARALLRNPTLLILDEATNALDPENEARILDAIQALRGTLTVLMIAHRPSALARADRLFILDHGELRQGDAA
jgi:ATP-binding cassette, subfamily C, bacterial